MTQPTFIKAKCYRCEGKIEFPESHKNEAITCPHCLQPIRLDETIRIVQPSIINTADSQLHDYPQVVSGRSILIGLFVVALIIGGVVGVVYYQQWKHEQHEKELRTIAYRLHLEVDTVRQAEKYHNNDLDETIRALERYNKLVEDIINKKPEVIDGLKRIGIEGDAALKQLLSKSPESIEKEIALRIASQMGLNEKISELRKKK